MRRSSGKNEVGLLEGFGGGGLLVVAVNEVEGLEEEEEKRDLRAAAAEEEEVEGRREEEEGFEELWSRVVKRSQRHEGQKPVNCSSGWRSQLKEERGG